MQVLKVHAYSNFIGINIFGGRDYHVRARWSTDLLALQDPPGVPLTIDNYFIGDDIYVAVEATQYGPVQLTPSPEWWQYAKDDNRNIYAIVEWRPNDSPNWRIVSNFDSLFNFIINHRPDANAGRDQRVILNDQGDVYADVHLDASGSHDIDMDAAINPDPGPLNYSWMLVENPVSAIPDGPTREAGFNVDRGERPLFLQAGRHVPFEDRGVYRFSVYVSDNDIAATGYGGGTPEGETAYTRVLVGVNTSYLNIDSPTSLSPHFGFQESGVQVRVNYSIGDNIANDPAYSGAWVVRMRIYQAMPCPIFFSPPNETLVYEDHKVSFQRVNYLTWDGVMNQGALATQRAFGAFTVELELLDRNWQSTGVAQAVRREERSIVLDMFNWLNPLDVSANQIVTSGTFMESGHAGYPGTRLHAGMDFYATGIASPEIIAVRSGFYHRNGHQIELTHTTPHRTWYLHGNNYGAHNNGDLVLQGDKLANLSDQGATGNPHLHFGYRHVDHLGAWFVNPLNILNSIEDVIRPEIVQVYIRAPYSANEASRTAASTGINGQADLIVRCRDWAHPARSSAVSANGNAPYGIVVNEINRVGAWNNVRFEIFTPGNHLREYYSRDSFYNYRYHLYTRWQTNVYNRRVSPLTLEVVALDFSSTSAVRTIMIGPEVEVANALPNPATTAGDPQPFTINLRIGAHVQGVDLNRDNYHIQMEGAPAGWTFSPDRTGNMSNGVSRVVPITVNPNGNAPTGERRLFFTVYSNILQQVGLRMEVRVRVNP